MGDLEIVCFDRARRCFQCGRKKDKKTRIGCSACRRAICGEHRFPLCMTCVVLLVKGRTGKDLLMLNGYTYYQHKVLRDGFRWSCTQMGSRSCRGFLHVTDEMLVVRAHTEHTHPPSMYFLEKIRQQFAEDVDAKKSSSDEEDKSELSLKISNIHGAVGF